MMIYQSQYVPFLRLLAGVPIVDADHTPHFQGVLLRFSVPRRRIP